MALTFISLSIVCMLVTLWCTLSLRRWQGEINKTQKKGKEKKKKREAFGVPPLPPGLMRSV